MSGLSRRTFLHASAAAAAAAAVLATPGAAGAADSAEASGSAGPAGSLLGSSSAAAPSEPLIVHIRDASTGEVSVLHGTSEVVYHDPELVRRVVRAATRSER
jgi:hypothetical protein